MNKALIIVDMIRDNVYPEKENPMSKQARKIIPNIQRLIEECRNRKILIVYASDSFMIEDFDFKKRKPHALRGTAGVEVIDEIKPQKNDVVLEKRCNSAFFKTDLDITLRRKNIDTIIVAGISTPYCVLMTVLDGIQYGFEGMLLEDCCATHKEEINKKVLDIYREGPLKKVLSIKTLDEFIKEN